jgi:hypothetical protein
MTSNTTLAQDTADRLSVADALYRFAAGIDLRDKDLLASALSEDAISDFRPAAAKAGFEYPVLQGRDTLVAALSASLSALDTTHSVSNARVILDGDTARMEALVEAQHVPRDDHSRHYLMKNRYDVDLIRSGDVWVMTRIVVDNVWRSGDAAVLAGV